MAMHLVLDKRNQNGRENEPANNLQNKHHSPWIPKPGCHDMTTKTTGL
jgi:hypothetical protein